MALDEKEAEKDDIHFSFQARRPEKFLKRYISRRTIARKPGSGRPSLVTMEVKHIV